MFDCRRAIRYARCRPVAAGAIFNLMLVAAMALLGNRADAGIEQAGPGMVRQAGPGAGRNSDRTRVKVSFVSIPVSHAGRTWQLAGERRIALAPSSTPMPAVVIVHGSGGVDSRGGALAAALNDAGFATLEVDLWAARGVSSPADRPRAVTETLPDAFAALEFLSRDPAIDPRRIGITGFSWGGVVSMLSATRANRDAYATGLQAFAAHAPWYPVCWVYNTVPGYEFGDLTGSPVLIQAGSADTYDAPDSCTRLHAGLSPETRSLVSVSVYPGSTHAWNRQEADTTIVDPYAHLGKGGSVPLVYDEAVTRQSTDATVSFFVRTLGSP